MATDDETPEGTHAVRILNPAPSMPDDSAQRPDDPGTLQPSKPAAPVNVKRLKTRLLK